MVGMDARDDGKPLYPHILSIDHISSTKKRCIVTNGGSSSLVAVTPSCYSITYFSGEHNFH